MSRSSLLDLGNTPTAGATFDPSRRYRYTLWRDWGLPRRRVLWIMLNPSTADEAVLDPTIRRCVGFSQAWGYTGLVVVNLFALRSTDPSALLSTLDPVGPTNNEEIAAALAVSTYALAAWGAHPLARARGRAVRDIAGVLRKPLYCLGTTKDGHPRHPLYLASRTAPQLLEPPTR